MLRESIARTIAISAIYALIEAFFTPSNQGNVISPYHVLVFLIALVAGFDRNIKITIANTLLFSVLEELQQNMEYSKRGYGLRLCIR